MFDGGDDLILADRTTAWGLAACQAEYMATTAGRTRVVTVTTLVAVAWGLGACSSSAGQSGQALIEGELADTIGLGELDASCNEPDGLKEGETFTCTATTEDGTTIEFLGTMTSDDKFDVVTTNLLTADDVLAIRTDAAVALGEQVGQEIRPDDIVCPDNVVVLDDTGVFVCQITDTTAGDVYELTVSTGGIEPGGGVRDLQYSIADQPL